MSDNLFNEVEERVREEQLLKFARRWGPWIAGVLAAALIAACGWYGWRYVSTLSAREHAVAFVAAQDLYAAGDLDGAQAAFAAIETEGPSVYRLMTRMHLAAIQVDRGELEAALAAFDSIAEDASNELLRDSARLRAAYIVADTQDLTALRGRLQPMIEEAGPYTAMAKELLAFESWEAGEEDAARDLFQELILSIDTPAPIRNRADLFVNSLLPRPAPSEDAAADAASPDAGEAAAEPAADAAEAPAP